MALRDQLLKMVNGSFTDQDGVDCTIELLGGLSDIEIEAFGERFPGGLRLEMGELLRLCRGFEFRLMGRVDFTGGHAFHLPEVFPLGVPICGDGLGNFWVVDVDPVSGTWGPIFYACHDPPVIAVQASGLGAFLDELFKLGVSGERSSLDVVREDVVTNIWKTNPEVIDGSVALTSNDTVIRGFAEVLSGDAEIVDLRGSTVGTGFSWGRYGPKTEVTRYGGHLVFGIRRGSQIRSWFDRLFAE